MTELSDWADGDGAAMAQPALGPRASTPTASPYQPLLRAHRAQMPERRVFRPQYRQVYVMRHLLAGFTS